LATVIEALLGSITDPRPAGLPRLGAVDTYLDNTVLLTERPRVRAAAAAVLPGMMG
jgi:hypothetical protein